MLNEIMTLALAQAAESPDSSSLPNIFWTIFWIALIVLAVYFIWRMINKF